MSIVEEFLEHYSREIDHFAAAAGNIHQAIESALAVHGVRAIVTSRAKGIKRLRDKVEKRNRANRYKTINGIYKDIIDLAGVRVALYFPGDRVKVGSIMDDLFTQVKDPKTFPMKGKRKQGKRFDGYVATHYLVRPKSDNNPQSENRYINTTVEIQVASVLMHAWAEVEHDLEYKPELGKLSGDESAILDELNGLVLTGELALERLQRAIQRRVGMDDVVFRDQFDLASFLSQRAHKEGMDNKDVGRVDALLVALRYLKIATPSKVKPIFANLTDEDRGRPIADVLIDRLLARRDRGGKLAEIVGNVLTPGNPNNYSTEHSQIIGAFLLQWQEVEKLVGQLASRTGHSRPRPFGAALKLANLPEELSVRLYAGSSLRNMVVHGMYTSNFDAIVESTRAMKIDTVPRLKEVLTKRNKAPRRLLPSTSPQ